MRDALRRSEANLKKAQELAGVGSWEFDVATGELRWSDHIYVILGRDPALGPPAFDEYMRLVHPDDRERMQALARAAIERAEANEVEYRVETPQGLRIVRSVAGPELGPDGEVIRVHGALMDVTEARQAEHALRRSEANLRRAQELARIGSWAFDGRTNRVEWTDGMYVITGRDPALGPPTADEFYEIVHPDDRDRMRDLVGKALAAGRGYDVEYRIRTPSGVAHLRSIAEPVEDGGRVTGLRGTLIDMTERKRSEERLRRSQENLEKAQELAHVGSWEIIYPDRLEWSSEVFRITGRDPALGPPTLREYLDDVHPDDREAMQRRLAEVAQSGEPYELQYRVVRPDGVRYVRSLGAPVKDEHGRTTSMQGTIIDATETVLAERALRESRERLELALAGGRMGLWDWDVEAGLVDWDARWAEMLGYAQAELAGTYRFWREHVHPDDVARVEAGLAAGLRQDAEYDVEYRMRTKEGGWIWTHSRGRVSERAADGRPLRMTGVQFDVTERHLAAAAARKAEERARRAEHLASIGTLAAGVAHELNNPLGGIVLAATWARDVLDRKGPDGIRSAHDALRDVLEDARRGQQIVQGVLKFARAEMAERRPVEAASLVARAVAAARPYAEERGARLSVDLADDLPILVVSEGEIVQVLVNLIRNGLESGEQGVEVAVRAAVADGHLCLHVDDNGRGLSDHVRKHLFEPFFTTRRDEGGTGLGLSLSHGIVTQHGGTIEAAPSPLGGTRFTVSLPLVPSASPGESPDGEDPGRRR